MLAFFQVIQSYYYEWRPLLIDHKIVLLLAYVSTFFVAVKLFKMGVEDHDAKANGGDPRGYPPLYFTMRAAQITPLLITGLVREDAFIFSSRAFMLFVIGVVRGMVKNPKGIFPWHQYRRWVYFWAFVLAVSVWAWTTVPEVKQFIRMHEQLLGFMFGSFSVVFMFAFVAIGQGSAIKSVWHGLINGHYQQPGFQLQLLQVSSFGLQALHYGAINDITDPFCMTNLIGFAGSTTLLGIHLLGRLGIWKFFVNRYVRLMRRKVAI